MTRCFVIGPIGDHLAPLGTPQRARYEEALEVFEKVILPASAANGLEPVRADQIAVSGEITEQIFRHLYEDEVVIADLSGGNANVMYELGMRHTRDLLTIQIGEYGQLPFDVNSVRTIMFSRSEMGLIDARNKLNQALLAGLAEGGDPVTATRIWQRSAENPVAVALDESEFRDDKDDDLGVEDDLDQDGFVESLAKVEIAFPLLTAHTGEMGELLNLLGSEAQLLGSEVNTLNSSGAPASARLSTIARYAGHLQERADQFATLSDRYAADMREIDSSVRSLLEYLDGQPDAIASEGVDTFLESVSTLARSGREAMGSLNGFAGIVGDLGRLSKTLRRPGRQIADAVQTIAKASAVMDAWESAATGIRRQAELNITGAA